MSTSSSEVLLLVKLDWVIMLELAMYDHLMLRLRARDALHPHGIHRRRCLPFAFTCYLKKFKKALDSVLCVKVIRLYTAVEVIRES
jgi:hypothetical protein